MATGRTDAVGLLPPLAKRRPDVPVEVLAARTLSLATLGPRRRAERRQESVAALEALAGASLLELRQRLPSRFWIVAMLSLGPASTRASPCVRRGRGARPPRGRRRRRAVIAGTSRA
jgi:hypothetical protein